VAAAEAAQMSAVGLELEVEVNMAAAHTLHILEKVAVMVGHRVRREEVENLKETSIMVISGLIMRAVAEAVTMAVGHRQGRTSPEAVGRDTPAGCWRSSV